MIKRSEELTPEIVSGLRGGKGSVTMIRLLANEQFQGKGRAFSKIVLAPGHSIGLHQHTGDVEAYYILSGEGRTYDNGIVTTLRPGDVMFTGDGESHSLENTGTTDLEFIALVLFV